MVERGRHREKCFHQFLIQPRSPQFRNDKRRGGGSDRRAESGAIRIRPSICSLNRRNESKLHALISPDDGIQRSSERTIDRSLVISVSIHPSSREYN